MVLYNSFSLFYKIMKLGTLEQFGALNIFRYGAIAKLPTGGHGGHSNIRHGGYFNIRHNQIMGAWWHSR